jgi:hypothetical protein
MKLYLIHIGIVKIVKNKKNSTKEFSQTFLTKQSPYLVNFGQSFLTKNFFPYPKVVIFRHKMKSFNHSLFSARAWRIENETIISS